MKKFSLLCITLMLFTLNATVALAAAVTVNGAGSVVDGGAAVNTTYTFTAGQYLYTIAGFGSGDVLIIPAVTSPSIDNVSFVDGSVDVSTLSPSGIITIRLTGITNQQDSQLLDLTSFRSVFGAGSLPTMMQGDPNGDKKVDVFDALLTLQYAVSIIAHNPTNDEKYLGVADVYPLDANQKPYGDNKVDVMDALLILQRAVGLLNW